MIHLHYHPIFNGMDNICFTWTTLVCHPVPDIPLFFPPLHFLQVKTHLFSPFSSSDDRSLIWNFNFPSIFIDAVWPAEYCQDFLFLLYILLSYNFIVYSIILKVHDPTLPRLNLPFYVQLSRSPPSSWSPNLSFLLLPHKSCLLHLGVNHEYLIHKIRYFNSLWDLTTNSFPVTKIGIC